MQDALGLQDPYGAQQFISGFPTAERNKGLWLFRRERVVDLFEEDTPGAYCATVEDDKDFEVLLRYQLPAGWTAQCSCPQRQHCAHIYAAMTCLLADFQQAAIRGLSAGRPEAAAALEATRPRSGIEAGEMGRRLAAALGRSLNREEKAFLQRLHQVYEACRVNRHISHWDFASLGLPVPEPEPGRHALEIWPSFPANPYEFWLYVANALAEAGRPWPSLLDPITDLAPIKERLTRWRRSRQIEQWKQALQRQTLEPDAHPAEPPGETDLRLLIGENMARLEQRRPGQEHFEPFNQKQFRQFIRAWQNDSLPLGLEAQALWRCWEGGNFYYSVTETLDYESTDELRVLARVLRMRAVESRVVNSQGAPLPRPAEPLRWEVLPAQNDDDDYLLRLVRADDTPPPHILAVFTGSPTLYLTAEALFVGPPGREGLLKPQDENRIPAQALEQPAGVTFLEQLGVPLPGRIQERLLKLPLEVHLHCELKPSYSAHDREDCYVRVTAAAPDGHSLSWTGFNWLVRERPKPRPKSGQGPIIWYDRTAMDRTPAVLEPLNLKPLYGGEELVARVTKKFPETFAAWLKALPPGFRVNLAGELASLATGDVAGRVSLEVTEATIDWFDLRVAVQVSDTTLTPAEIKLLLNAKGGYVRLEGKGWRRLRYDLSEDKNERLARLGLSPRELSGEPQRLHALQLADEAARKFLPAQQVEQVQRRVGELKARVSPPLPSGISAELRPYQLEGFHFLAYLSANRFGGILADDMGLGKTLQTLAWLLWLRETGPADRPAATVPPLPCLVVCPKSVMDTWHAEAQRFASALRVRVWPAAELPDFAHALDSADLHVLNYSQLRALGESVVAVHWLAVILDEGQYIKNPSSQTAQVARALRAEHRLVLTGTPIENRLLDLWSLMAFAMPGTLGSRAQFAKLYDAKGDPFARRRLASRVRPFVLRRTKAQVAKDLPDRIEEDLFCEIEGEQQTLYRAELKRAQQLLLGIKTQKELAQHQFHFLTSLLRLRQVCCHPRLMKPDSHAASAKTEALLDQLEPLMEEGQKVLVFSQFVEMLTLLKPEIEQRKWRYFYLAGETEDRGDLVREFQSSPGAAIFLISLKAGGFGLNLTAASYVVLFDPWWNPAVENQAIDRTHRIGQTNKVIAYRLLIKNSVEEKIRELQKQKRALAEDVLGEEKFAQGLTLSDLQFLFAD